MAVPTRRLPTATFRFKYSASEKAKQNNPNVATALEAIRDELERLRPEELQRELYNRADIEVEVEGKRLLKDPLQLEVTFRIYRNNQNRPGNVVKIYELLQKIERQTDQFLLYLLQSKHGDDEWLKQNGIQRATTIVETARFLSRTEQVRSGWSGFGYGVAAGALLGVGLTLYAYNHEIVHSWIQGLKGS